MTSKKRPRSCRGACPNDACYRRIRSYMEAAMEPAGLDSPRPAPGLIGADFRPPRPGYIGSLQSYREGDGGAEL